MDSIEERVEDLFARDVLAKQCQADQRLAAWWSKERESLEAGSIPVAMAYAVRALVSLPDPRELPALLVLLMDNSELQRAVVAASRVGAGRWEIAFMIQRWGEQL